MVNKKRNNVQVAVQNIDLFVPYNPSITKKVTGVDPHTKHDVVLLETERQGLHHVWCGGKIKFLKPPPGSCRAGVFDCPFFCSVHLAWP